MTNESYTLSREALQSRVDKLARVQIAHLPTPLEFCPRLTEALGGPEIWIKRDDCTGLALGGNKTRQLEYIFAEALQQGADTIVAGSGSQSNWCRQTAAAACKFGIKTVLILVHGVKGAAFQGNLLLDQLLGADVTIVEGEDLRKLPPLLEERVEKLRREGRKPYLVNPFGLPTLSLAAVGYVNAFIELDAQLEEQGKEADYIYMSGANITPAGMALGVKALCRKTRVMGITPISWDEDRPTDIAHIADATAERLELDIVFRPEEIYNEDGYVGERYGVMTPECREALKLVARTEGIILDPVYTSKAMAGLIDHIRQGRITKNETVIFLHTGGTPALFAYAEDLELTIKKQLLFSPNGRI
ncbi:MAG: D-cysteine desulfhydrase family protein [Deltaproteobacteria bacterium]|nr:D-cysteine desulfhydrase family protein [Deltaproteobacteria bacterium]MBW1912140.1 D-cysteine desulfhydrase family protein [Deltaproteobacteria bacterium]